MKLTPNKVYKNNWIKEIFRIAKDKEWKYYIILTWKVDIKEFDLIWDMMKNINTDFWFISQSP